MKTAVLRNTLIIIVTFTLARPFGRIPTVSATAAAAAVLSRRTCNNVVWPNKRKGVEMEYAGLTYEEWANYRFDWLSAALPSEDPDSDTTGQYAYQNQPEDLFLLAYSYNGQSGINRYITVPSGIPLFVPTFPIFDFFRFITSPTIESLSDPSFFISILASVGVNVTLKTTVEEYAELYGKAYCENIIFNLTLRVDNCNIDPFQQGLIWTKASHSRSGNFVLSQCGYYHILAPLKPGNHTITYTGNGYNNSNGFFWSTDTSFGPFSFRNEVKYHISVV